MVTQEVTVFSQETVQLIIKTFFYFGLCIDSTYGIQCVRAFWAFALFVFPPCCVFAILIWQLNVSMPDESFTRCTHWKSRQVIRVKASTAAEGLVTRQNVWILQQRQLSWCQSFTQLLRLLIGPSLPVHDCIQQASGRDPPLCGWWWAERTAIECHSIWSVLDGIWGQAEWWSWHQPVTAQQKVALRGGEVST